MPYQEKFYATRFRSGDEELVYGPIGREWSFFIRSDGREHRVGEVYRTKTELLSDLDRYAWEYGF